MIANNSVLYTLKVLSHHVGGRGAAVAMGVAQANYRTYIKVVQLYITSMQTAVFTQKIIPISPTLFKILTLQVFTYFRILLSYCTPVSQENLAAGASLHRTPCVLFVDCCHEL